MWISITGAVKVIGGVARSAAGDLSFVKGLIEAGELRTVIDRRHSLDEIAEVHRYGEAGHKKGNVVIVLEQASRELAGGLVKRGFRRMEFRMSGRQVRRGKPEDPHFAGNCHPLCSTPASLPKRLNIEDERTHRFAVLHSQSQLAFLPLLVSYAC